MANTNFQTFLKLAKKTLPVELANGDVPSFNVTIDSWVKMQALFFTLMNPGNWTTLNLEGEKVTFRATTITVNSAEYDEWFVVGFLRIGHNEVKVEGLISTQEEPAAKNWGYLQFRGGR